MSDQKCSELLNEIESTLFKCIHNEQLSGEDFKRYGLDSAKAIFFWNEFPLHYEVLQKSRKF